MTRETFYVRVTAEELEDVIQSRAKGLKLLFEDVMADPSNEELITTLLTEIHTYDRLSAKLDPVRTEEEVDF